jgi:SAM-dependent methyltransferase
VALTDESSPAFLPGFFELALGSVLATSTITEAARTGTGYGWHEQAHEVHEGCERFFRPGYNAHLIAEWLPALDGVVDLLQHGGAVADVGCGHGASTVLMAQEFPTRPSPASTTTPGRSPPPASAPRPPGSTTGSSSRPAGGAGFPGTDYDLVTTFDCLHDMGDPVGTARHVLGALRPEGSWMIVEPAAGDRVEDNLNPVGRAYYGFSTLLCTPSSLSQDVGLALGAQAGEARLREVVTKGGFTRFQRVAETPFNIVFEARP